jgi:hypothetical protein
MGEIQMSRKFNAILGLGALAAFGFASSAFAQCPTATVPPWTSQSNLGGTVVIAAGGYDTTACRMDATITTNGPGVNAFVRDNTPATEPRYRAQFLINVDALTGLNSIQSSKIFGATTDTANLNLTDIVRLSVFGNLQGTSKVLGILTVCEGQSGNQCAATTALAAGVNRVEIDWDQAGGSLRVWVNSAVEGTPTVTLPGNSAGWAGVDYATLGLTSPSPAFRAAQLNRPVGFDEFDSRRTSFIGE